MRNEDIKGLDVKKGLSIVANNVTIYQKLLKSFVTNAFCDQLLDAIYSGDLTQIRQKAHSFKGVSGNMHMNKLYELCQAVEANARDCKSITATDDLVIQLISSNKQTLKSVHMLLDNPAILNNLE